MCGQSRVHDIEMGAALLLAVTMLLTVATTTSAPTAKPWLAYKWEKVVNASGTKNILPAPCDVFYHLSPKSKGFLPGWAADWAAKLLDMPAGQRGFILHDYGLDVDPGRNPADGHSLWWQHGIAGAANKTRYIAAALKAEGVQQVDYAILDFESGLSKSYLGTLTDTELAAIVSDPRYSADITTPQSHLQDILTGDPSPPTKDATPAAIRHGNWDLDCYRWNDLNRVRVAGFLNEALAKPLVEAFPGIEVSNYGASRVAGTIVPDVNGHPVCRFGAGTSTPTVACGAVVGTHDSFSMYGTFGQLQHGGWQNNPDKARFPTEYNATPANAFRMVLNHARAATLARAAAAGVGQRSGGGSGLHAWVQPKEMVIGSEPTPLACPDLIADPAAPCASGTYWEETLLHVALSGVSAFGFWGTTGNDTAWTDKRLSNVLTELDGVAGAADRAPFNATIVDWAAVDALVVSSMTMSSREEEGKRERGTRVIVHRVVCLAQGSELSTTERNDSVTLSCGGDAGIRRVLPRSRVLKMAQPVSPMGAWVLQQP